MKRSHYLILTFCTVALGILSRKITVLPLCLGDFLYAVMAYFGMRFLGYRSPRVTIAIASLSFCFAIELLQLCQSGWIRAARKTAMGHYVLGQGFLWSDLLAYCCGVCLAFLADSYLSSKKIPALTRK